MNRPWLTALRDAQRTRAPSSLYIHIPFCGSRCFYCDFTTYVAPKAVRETYVEDLCAELRMIAREATMPLETVFFGGGTPTLLSADQLHRVLSALHANFTVQSTGEITVEANPGTVDADKLRVLREHGVNRISFGAQTLNERLLMAIGRLHDAETVFGSVEQAREAGVEHVNVDLMFGLPDQSLEDVRASLDGLYQMGVDHVSAYWLKVEPGTPFARWQSQGALPLPGEDAEADMYELVRLDLEKHGFRHYEVSNFARQGCEARHNLVYWRNEPYFAAGVGAHGYVHGERHENVASLTDYHRLVSEGRRPMSSTHDVSLLEAVEDTMMLGLRLRDGVSESGFADRHGVEMRTVFGDVLQRLFHDGLLESVDGSIRLTDRAWPIANVVFEEFVGLGDEIASSD